VDYHPSTSNNLLECKIKSLYAEKEIGKLPCIHEDEKQSLNLKPSTVK